MAAPAAARRTYFILPLMPNPARTTITFDLHRQDRGPNTHVSTKAMYWYDAIIDDMLSHPGTTQKATAERLGRTPVTINYIINSDMFRARYAQRRNRFNEELDQKMIGKLAKVAELSLDLVLEKMDTSRTGVPLPLLNDIMNKSLERLGYGPKPQPAQAVQVNVSQTNQVAVPQTVSAEALASARDTLRSIEQSKMQSVGGVAPNCEREALGGGAPSSESVGSRALAAPEVAEEGVQPSFAPAGPLSGES